VSAKLANAAPSESYDLCVRVATLGGIPTESTERCATAYFEAGRRLATDERTLTEGRDALRQAVSLLPANKDARAALTNVTIALALQRGKLHLLEMKQAKDRSVAIQAAQLVQTDLQEALKLEPDRQELKDMNAKVVTWLSQAKASQKKDDERKRGQEEAAAEKRDAALYLKESCNRLAGMFGTGSSLSELQKEELWKQYEGKMFNWTMEFVDADSETFGDGVVAHWKCQDSDSFVSDLLITYPAGARASVLQLHKGAFYKIKGRLKRTSTLLGLSGQPL
jgi:hypothetical protein